MSILQRNSLTRYLTLTYALMTVCSLAISFGLLFWSIHQLLNTRLNDDLLEDIEEFRIIFQQEGITGIKNEMARETINGEAENEFQMLIDSSGSVVHSTDQTAWGEYKIDNVLVSRQFETDQDPVIRNLDLPSRDDITRIVHGKISQKFLIIIGESTVDNSEIMGVIGKAFVLVFLFALPLIAFFVWYLTRRALSGIQSVSSAALDITAGNLDRRVKAQGQVEEVQTLADTFDSMADRIRQLIESTREITDNITHDMRSPLGRIRLLLESILNDDSSNNAIKRSAEVSITECDRLIEMINTSLDVSETEAGVSRFKFTEFDFSQIVADVYELFEAAAEEKSISMTQAISATSTMVGDVSVFQRLVANLVDNAVKYTPDNGKIELCLYESKHMCKLIIRNTGPGIAEESYEKIFNRFYRIDPSRSTSGCGLGLSYVRAVVRAHEGDVKVHSVLDEFVEFTIELPLQQSLSKLTANHAHQSIDPQPA